MYFLRGQADDLVAAKSLEKWLKAAKHDTAQD